MNSDDLLYLGIGTAMFLIALLFVRERRTPAGAGDLNASDGRDATRGRS